MTTERRTWTRTISSRKGKPVTGPWHLAPRAHLTTACGRAIRGVQDMERYAGVPSGYGPGRVCPDCEQVAFARG